MRRNGLLILKSEIRSRGFRGGIGGAAESSESEEYVFDEEELLDFVVTELSDFDDNSSELSDSEDEE